MKKVFLGLFVAAVALSASAFTNAEKTNLSSNLATIYYQVDDLGNYADEQPEGTVCTGESDFPCRLIFEEEQTVPGFNIGTPPSEDYEPDGDTNYYQ
jgi:hypothetical protein